MISCPTGALTNRSVVKIVMDKEGQIREDEQWQAIARDRQKRMQEIAAQTTAEQGAFTEPSPATKTAAEPAADPRRAAQFLRPGPVPARAQEASSRAIWRYFRTIPRLELRRGRPSPLQERRNSLPRGRVRLHRLHHRARTSRGPYPQSLQAPRATAQPVGSVFRPRRSHARRRGKRNDPARLINIDAPVALEYGNPVAVLDPSHLHLWRDDVHEQLPALGYGYRAR